MYKWITLKFAPVLEFSVRRNEAERAATYEVNGCIIYADRRALQKLVLPKRPPESYTILNVVECALIAMDHTLVKRQRRIGSHDNRRMNNLLRNCLRFQLCSHEYESIYLLHPCLPRQVVVSIPVSVSQNVDKNFKALQDKRLPFIYHTYIFM